MSTPILVDEPKGLAPLVGTGGSTKTGTATPGGDATSKVNLTSYVDGAPVNAEAYAYAGAGGSTGSPGQYASSGQAIAHATVSGFNAEDSALAVAGTLSPDDMQTSPVAVTASSDVQAQGAFASHALANTGAASYPTDPSGDVTAGFAAATASPTGVVVPGRLPARWCWELRPSRRTTCPGCQARRQ